MPNRATTTGLPRADIQGSLMELPPTERYLALDIFSPFPVQKNRGSYGVIPREASRKRGNVNKAAGSGYNRGEWNFEDATYRCRKRGWEEVKDDEEAAEYADLFDYEVVLGGRCRQVVLTEQEIRCKDLIHNTTTFAQSGNTGLAVTNEWDDFEFADPIGDVQRGREGIRARSGFLPNTLQVAWQTWYDLWNCDQVKERRPVTILQDTPDPDDMAARRALATILGLKDILIGDQAYDSALEGQTTVIADIWSQEYAFLFYRDPNPRDIARPTLGRCHYNEKNGGLLSYFDYREEAIEGEVIRAKQCVGEALVVSECGFLFSNIYTA